MLVDDQIKAVTKVIKSGNLSSLHGKETEKFEKTVAEYLGVKHAVAVNSGTSALQLGLLACGITTGDEVIVPATSFIATAGAICSVGAKPIFVDINLSDFNINTELIEDRITEKTRAILPVHMAGFAAEMYELVKIASRNHLMIIEDACQAFGAEYAGMKLGTMGQAGCFSFYPSKIITTGEGGMVVTQLDYVADNVRSLRHHGIVGEYKHGVGYNYRMTEMAAALGNVGMKYLDMKKNSYIRRVEILKEQAIGRGFVLSTPVPVATPLGTYVPIRYKEPIKNPNFYPPMYYYSAYRDFSGANECPMAEHACKYVYKVSLL